MPEPPRPASPQSKEFGPRASPPRAAPGPGRTIHSDRAGARETRALCSTRLVGSGRGRSTQPARFGATAPKDLLERLPTLLQTSRFHSAAKGLLQRIPRPPAGRGRVFAPSAKSARDHTDLKELRALK